MSLTNDEIAEVLNASDADPEVLVRIVELAGLDPTGDAVEDIRSLAETFDVDEESLLYGLFSEESPLWVDPATTDLFPDDEEEWS